MTPTAKFDPKVVLKFYANAWPTEEGVRDMRSWVKDQIRANGLQMHDNVLRKGINPRTRAQQLEDFRR